MQDTPRVRRREPRADLTRDRQRPLRGQLPGAPQERGHVLAFDVLHRQERLSVQVTQVVDATDVGVRDTPRDTHLRAQSIDERRIALMKDGASIINTARGELIDQEALIAALESGKLAGAGLDVYPDEPHVDPRLLRSPNVMTLPHIGSATAEGREASGEKVIANIRFWADGHRPPDQVLTALIH